MINNCIFLKPTLISSLEELAAIRLTREDELSYNITIYLQRDRVLTFSMEDRDGAELGLVLAGYVPYDHTISNIIIFHIFLLYCF